MASVITLPEIKNEDQVIYTYTFEVKFYDPEDEKISITPLTVGYAHKECDYQGAFNPVYIMQLEVTKIDMFKLKQYQKNIIASITVISSQYIRLNMTESGGYKETELLDTKIVSSGLFQPIFSQTSFDEKYMEDQYLNEEFVDTQGTTAVTSETNRVVIEVQFEDLSALDAKKTTINMVVDENATVGTILSYLVDTTPVKGAIIDLPDNNYAFGKDTVIPPGNLVPTLKLLQNVYGVYENGMSAFYDNNILYILNKYALDHDCEKDDKITTHIYITELEQVSGPVIRGLDPETKEPVYIGSIIATVLRNELVSGELEGNNFIFSSFKQGISAVQYKDNKAVKDNFKPVAIAMKRNIETYKYSSNHNVLDYDELNNAYNMASFFNETEAMAKQIAVTLENVNINDFKPNNLVNLHFINQDKNLRLGDVYHILNFTTIFKPVNVFQTKEMVCMSSLTLSRRGKKMFEWE
jgi:hypothetical protein